MRVFVHTHSEAIDELAAQPSCAQQSTNPNGATMNRLMTPAESVGDLRPVPVRRCKGNMSKMTAIASSPSGKP
ncbi:MAG TPA: hypothetical protein VGF24_33880 [Vicinamibacterales bacterium]